MSWQRWQSERVFVWLCIFKLQPGAHWARQPRFWCFPPASVKYIRSTLSLSSHQPLSRVTAKKDTSKEDKEFNLKLYLHMMESIRIDNSMFYGACVGVCVCAFPSHCFSRALNLHYGVLTRVSWQSGFVGKKNCSTCCRVTALTLTQEFMPRIQKVRCWTNRPLLWN